MAVSNKVGGLTAGFLEMTQQQIVPASSGSTSRSTSRSSLSYQPDGNNAGGDGQMPGPTR